MNATSLYVSTTRLVIQANADDHTSWSDLYRLFPYLRQSLSCTVCDKLLIEPYTPTESSCQHHVCKSCRGGKKRLKPSCSWCKNYECYIENVQLRILLQCYKKLSEYLSSTSIYKKLTQISTNGGTNGLLDIIQEGAGFKDEFTSSSGLTKSAYSILPCVFTPSSTANVQTQTQTLNTTLQEKQSTLATVPINNPANLVTCSNDSTLVIKSTSSSPASNSIPPIKKIKVRRPKVKLKRKGCRCGNATSVPGKLTCCGQRCPCYVEGKACLDCRCRGCRNTHTVGGKQLRPFTGDPGESLGDSSNISTSSLIHDLNVPSYVIQGTSLYSNSPLSVEPVEQVPTMLLVDDEKSDSDSDIDVDV